MAQIVKEKMHARNLDPYDIDLTYRFQNVPGYGIFTCKECGDRWTSYMCWIRIDLSRQYICRSWKQKHKVCGGEAVPRFSRSGLEYMIDLVLDRYEYLVEYDGQLPGQAPGNVARRLKNHDHVNCEKCHWGDCQKNSRQCCIRH